jgi:hypothetical protein
VRVDLADLRRFVRKRRFFHALTRGILNATRQRYVTIDYSEIGDPIALIRVLELLEVAPGQPLEVRTVKQNPLTLQDRIENYAEISRALAGTEMARHLDPISR